MRLRVANQKSSEGQRFTWISIGTVAVAIGLALLAAVLFNSEVTKLIDLAFLAVAVTPCLLWIASGLLVVLRVTGVLPRAKVKALGLLTLLMTASIGALGSVFSLAIWAIGRSSWVHEGGDISEMPNGALVAAIVCGVVAAVSLALFFAAFAIDDSVVGSD